MGHRICIMDKGEVVQIGAPLEVYRNPVNTFVAQFLGNPPMNLVPIELGRCSGRLGRVSIPLRSWSETALGPARGVLLGIRPEDLYETPPRPGDDLVPIAMQVSAVEPLGAETLLVLTLDDDTTDIIARVGRDTRLRIGERATILLDTTTVHLFDPITTRVIARDLA